MYDIPRFAQLHICDAILFTKVELYLAECIKSSSVEANLLLQRLLDEVALIDRDVSFTRHLAPIQAKVSAAVKVVGDVCGD
jgi:hypothetical protein